MNTNNKNQQSIVKTPRRGSDGFYSPIGARMPLGTDLAKDVLYSAIRAGVSNDTLARLATDLHDNIRAASDAYCGNPMPLADRNDLLMRRSVAILCL